MASIMTVLGPCRPTEIGITSIHEHLFNKPPAGRHDPDARLGQADTAIEELLAFKEAGGGAMVEVTTLDLGRDVGQLVKTSAATGVKIVASTGFYKCSHFQRRGEAVRPRASLSKKLRATSIDQLTALFIDEVRDGVAGTDAKVGMIGEIGTSYHQILKEEEKVFRAAARANRETGVPISTHATLGTMGREQIEILKQEGADLGHVVIGHLDLVSDTPYHTELARKGVFLGFDTIGKEEYLADATRAELIQKLVTEGFEDQIVLACDISRRSQLKRHGGRGYAYLLDSFVPRLEAVGIDGATIHKFLVENPGRLLAF
jgi:predicted metal-dependent phosphotriesterase family hydrolase